MSTKKKTTSKKSNETTIPPNTQPTLTEDIIQLILQELQEQLNTNDFQGMCKNLVLYEGLLEEDKLFNMNIMGTNITIESRKQWDKLIDQVKVIHRKWVKTIKLNDTFEILNDYCWFPVKAISVPDNDIVDIHFNGWDKKHNQTIHLLERSIVPLGTFCGSEKRGKSSALVSSSSSSAAAAATSVVGATDAGVTDGSTEGNGSSSTTPAVEEPVAVSRSGRVIKKIQETSKSTERKSNTDGTGKKGGKKAAKEKDYNDWVCSICSMLEAPKGSSLMLCDGPCRRSFHLECLEDESIAQLDSWLCDDCVQGVHACFVCSKRGIDYVEVNKCSNHTCGKYYHLKCIQGNDLPFLQPTVSSTKVDLAADSEVCKKILQSKKFTNKLTQKANNTNVYQLETFSFRCPLHSCDTCFVHYGAVDLDDLCPCSYCPRSFHTNCIPPGSRFNSICLVCPLHPTMMLPGQALPSSMLPTTSSGSSKDTEYTNAVNMFFDQLAIPDFQPDANQLYDNHYRLQLYMKEEIESTPLTFKLITKNNYEKLPHDKMPPLMIPDSGCDCRQEDGCHEQCYNRLMRVECCDMKTSGRDDNVCRLGASHCHNRALQKKEYVRTKVFKEGNMGLGLKSLEYVKSGRLVIEYMGEIIDEEEMQKRLVNQRTLTPNDRDYYVMELANGIYVDGKFEGNVSRFINHSCDPNCELQRWNVRGRTRIGIFAIRDIQPGESLSYDYQFDTQEEDVFKCYCGTSKCRGTMAPNKKDRLAKLMQDNKLTKDMRQKLIQAGMNKEKKVTEESKIEDEWTRSYTGRCIPGDDIHEMKLGPVQNTFPFAKYHRLFLVRNVLQSTDFLARKKLLDNRCTNAGSQSQTSRGNVGSSSGRAKKSNGGAIGKKAAESTSEAKPNGRGGRKGGKRSHDVMSDGEGKSSDAPNTSSSAGEAMMDEA